MIKSIEIRNFRKFQRFNLRLQEGNILVGPNNSGKSTILDAFRLLDACLRHSKSKSPKLIDLKHEGVFDGYELSETLLPFRIANVTHNYDETDAIIEFHSATGNRAVIRAHPNRLTRFYIDAKGSRLLTTSKFRSAFPVDLVIVPTLAPLESDEPYVLDETVQKNRRNRLASRVLRNVWLREDQNAFDEFRSEIEAAWPSVILKKPELVRGSPPTVEMYFSENRKDREVQWAGFGFQAWLQIHTHLRRGSRDALLVIDEPDVYLHSDLQRRLLRRIRERFNQFIMATHSVEIINDADAKEIVSINPLYRSGKRINTDEEYEAVYKYLGSSANADLSRISRARRVIFVEGKDGKILRKLGARLGLDHVAEATNVPIVQLGGFSRWRRAQDAMWAFKSVMDLDIEMFCLFDRDYRSDDEVQQFLAEARESGLRCVVLERKEIENYLIQPAALHRALIKRIKSRSAKVREPSEQEFISILEETASKLKTTVMSQRTAQSTRFQEETRSKLDRSTLIRHAMEKFDVDWSDATCRYNIVPGKEFIARMNDKLQSEFSVCLTEAMIIDNLSIEHIPSELRDILLLLNDFCTPA